MADSLEARRKHVHQEPPNKLACRKRHHAVFLLMLAPVVLPLKRDLPITDRQQALVTDGDTMRIAAQVLNHLLCSPKWRFRIHHPLPFVQRLHGALPDTFVIQICQLAEESEPVFVVGALEPLDKHPAKESGKNPDGKEESRFAKIYRPNPLAPKFSA